MNQDHHKPRRRRRTARIYLAIVFILLRAADAALIWFWYHPSNTHPALIGAIVGSIATTTALIIAIWRRQAWARYVLLVVLWIMMAILSLPLMEILDRSEGLRQMPVYALTGSMGLYLLVIVFVTVSRRIRQLVSTRDSQ